MLPADFDSEIYPNGNSWNWDSKSQSTANGLKHIFTCFEHVVAFLLSKELLEPIKPIAECLQGQLQEVHFGFKKLMMSRNVTNNFMEKQILSMI